MAFDSLGMFHDGTEITADIALTTLTRTNGSAVLDLRQSPFTGWAVVMIVGADLAETDDTLTVTIEECATVDGTYVEVATFPVLTKGTGMPGTYIRRFDTNKQFVRCKIDVYDADSGTDFTVTGVYIFLCPPAFNIL